MRRRLLPFASLALAVGGVAAAGGVVWAHPGPRAELVALSRRLEAGAEPTVLVERAALRRTRGQLDEASRDLDLAEARGAAAAPVALERARLAIARGDDRAAGELLAHALRGARPDGATEPSRLLLDALSERAALRARAGEIDEARSDWDAAFAARPTAEAALARGALDRRRGDRTAEVAGYREALRQVPSVALRRALARAEMARGAWDAAIAVADEALAARAARVDWLLLRADAHAGAGRHARAEGDRRDALAEAERDLAARPSDLRRLALARALLALGRRDDAAAIATSVLRARPGLDEAKDLLEATRADVSAPSPSFPEASR